MNHIQLLRTFRCGKKRRSQEISKRRTKLHFARTLIHSGRTNYLNFTVLGQNVVSCSPCATGCVRQFREWFGLRTMFVTDRYITFNKVMQSTAMHELRMQLSEVFFARFYGHFSFTEHALFSVVISFAAKDPSYAGGFALHRCRLESNMK